MVVNDVVISMENIAIDYYEYTREKVFSLGKIERIQAVKMLHWKYATVRGLRLLEEMVLENQPCYVVSRVC